MSMNKKEMVIPIDKTSDIKEINRIIKEILQLFHNSVIDNKINENEKINEFINLFIEIYNLCKDKSKSKPIEIKIEFQKKYDEIKKNNEYLLENNEIKSTGFIILITITLYQSLKEMIKNIKDLEKKVILEEFSEQLIKESSMRIFNFMNTKT